MRKVWALFFAALVCIQVFHGLGILVYWTFNRQYIAQTLCINRGRPNLHCDGKCYLKKKLAAAFEYNTNTANSIKQSRTAFVLTPFIVTFEKLIILYPAGMALSFPGSSAVLAAGYTDTVFHPPAGNC